MLTGTEIANQWVYKNITIDPYDESQLNPNSYNLRLGDKLLAYTDHILDMKRDNPAREILIPHDGLILEPGELYLGSTVEVAGSTHYIPVIEGRSGIARLGIQIHSAAGFGDVGFVGQWTLEITVAKPVRIYAGVEFCQMAFFTPDGPIRQYQGAYHGQRGPQPSRLWRELSR